MPNENRDSAHYFSGQNVWAGKPASLEACKLKIRDSVHYAEIPFNEVLPH
jgi:hypothetical protein